MESFHSEFHTQLVTRSGEILTEPRGQRRHELTTDIDLVKILAIFWKEILKRFHEVSQLWVKFNFFKFLFQKRPIILAIILSLFVDERHNET